MLKRVKAILLVYLMVSRILIMAIPVHASNALIWSDDFTGTDGSALSSDWVLSIPTDLGTGGSASAVITGNALNMSMKKVNVSSKTFTATKTLDNPVTGTVEVDTRIKSVQNPGATSYVSTQFRLLDPSNSCLFTVTTYIGPTSTYFQYSLNNSSYTTISGAPDPKSAGPTGDGYHNVKIILDCNQKLATLYIDDMNTPLLNNIALGVSGSSTSLSKITLYSYLTSGTTSTYNSSYLIDYIYVNQVLAETDTDIVQAAYYNLTFSKLTSDPQNEIINNLKLPSAIDAGGESITWVSDTPNVISNTGNVTAGTTDQVVTLTATITKNQATMQKSFILTVLSQQSIILKVLAYIDSNVFDESINAISHNIMLPKVLYGTAIKWSSNSANLNLTDADANAILGTVILPQNWYSPEINVMLSANITRGTVSQVKEINLTLVKPIMNYQFDGANTLPDNHCEWTYNNNSVNCSVYNGNLNITADSNIRGMNIYYDKEGTLPLTGQYIVETRFNNTALNPLRIDLKSDNGSTILTCQMDSSYLISVYYGSGNFNNASFGSTLANNKWYRLKFVVNQPNKTVRLFLDDTELTSGTGVPFQDSNAANLKYVQLSGQIGGAVSYDYLKVYDNSQELINDACDAISIPEVFSGEKGIQLPVNGLNNTQITWQSDTQNIVFIDVYGMCTFTRPLYTGGNFYTIVNLTATIIKDSQMKAKTFPVIVLYNMGSSLTYNKYAHTNSLVPKYLPANSVDGDSSTFWESSDKNGVWLEVDFGSPVRFNKVVLDGLGDNVKEYTVEYSTDDKVWKNVCTSQLNNSQKVALLEFEDIKAQYLRYRIMDKADGPVQLGEFEAYYIPSDEKAVEVAAEALNLGDISNLTSNLVLPDKGEYDTNITWHSDNTDIITNDGILIIPETGNKIVVTLTATLSRGNVSANKIFKPVVYPKNPSIATNNTGGKTSRGSSGSPAMPINSVSPVQDMNKTDMDFTDVSSSSWEYPYIKALFDTGVIQGTEDKTFEPERNIAREEFVKMLITALQLQNENSAVNFHDVQKGVWCYGYIASAKQLGIVDGIDNDNFGIGTYITRQDMVVMIYRAAIAAGIKLEEIAEAQVSLTDIADVAEYAKEGVALMVGNGIINGFENNSFQPVGNATRAQAAKVIYLLCQKKTQ